MNKVNRSKSLKDVDFDRPNGIVSCSICKKSGKLAVDGVCNHDPRGSMVRTEYFVKGTEPTESCDVHTKVTICTASNLPANEGCPDSTITTRVYVIRPDGSVGVTSDSEYEYPKNFKKKTCNVHIPEVTSDDASADPNIVNITD